MFLSVRVAVQKLHLDGSQGVFCGFQKVNLCHGSTQVDEMLCMSAIQICKPLSKEFGSTDVPGNLTSARCLDKADVARLQTAPGHPCTAHRAISSVPEYSRNSKA